MTDVRLGTRFWAKVDLSAGGDGCWPWTASRDRSGYGRIWVESKMVSAHRVVWLLVNGDIPEGGYICHSCDNPPCVNPSHLFLGDAEKNMTDMVTKGRHGHHLKTRCRNGHEFTDENTYKWRGHRQCRKCNAEASQRCKTRKEKP